MHPLTKTRVRNDYGELSPIKAAVNRRVELRVRGEDHHRLPQRFRRLHRPGIKVLGHDQACTPKSAREPPEIATVVE